MVTIWCCFLWGSIRPASRWCTLLLALGLVFLDCNWAVMSYRRAHFDCVTPCVPALNRWSCRHVSMLCIRLFVFGVEYRGPHQMLYLVKSGLHFSLLTVSGRTQTTMNARRKSPFIKSRPTLRTVYQPSGMVC